MISPNHPAEQLELFAEGPFTLRVTIEDAVRIFWDNYWRHLPSAKTTAAHFRRIKTFFHGQYLDSISKADIERFRRWLAGNGYSVPTVNKAHMVLSRIYSKLAEYKEGRFVNGTDFSRIVLPIKNPAALVPKVNERRFARQFYITKEQKKILCSYADEDMAEIITGLYWTELRPSDFFRFTSENVDLAKATITGIQHKTITTRNPSGVPYKVSIPVEKLDIFRRRIQNTKPGTPLFRRKNIQKRWERVRALAATVDSSLAKAQMRDLRGSAASFLLDNGVDPETVRKGLGHATLRMLPVYDKRPEDRVVMATAKLAEV